jgi:hypothetical protein
MERAAPAADLRLALVSECFEVLVEELAHFVLRGRLALLLDEPFSTKPQQLARDEEGRSAPLVHAAGHPARASRMIGASCSAVRETFSGMALLTACRGNWNQEAGSMVAPLTLAVNNISSSLELSGLCRIADIGSGGKAKTQDGVAMRRFTPAALDGNQFPLTLAAGLRASFADVVFESLPDGLTALMSRLDANHGEQGHGPSAPEPNRADRGGRRRAA